MTRDDLEAQPAETPVEETQGQSEETSPSEGLSGNVVSITSNTDTIKATFDASLEQLRHHTEGGKVAARLCADLSIQHFALHGDLIYAQRLLDGMRSWGKNYMRPAAFVKWLTDFAPVKLEGDTLKKDKFREQNMWPDAVAKQDCIDRALATPFWDHKPDTELQRFGKMEILQAMRSTAKKFHNEEKYSAASEDAIKLLAEFEAFIDSKVENSAKVA